MLLASIAAMSRPQMMPPVNLPVRGARVNDPPSSPRDTIGISGLASRLHPTPLHYDVADQPDGIRRALRCYPSTPRLLAASPLPITKT